MDRQWFLLAGSVVLSFSLAHVYRVAATALQIVDHPNHRSAHTHTTPTGAGVTFIAVFCLCLWLLAATRTGTESTGLFLDLLPALLVVAVVGFIDDFRHLPWWCRALVHVGCAGWVVNVVGFPVLQVGGTALDAGMAGLVFGVVSAVWLLNLYNFMDGIDGLAIGEAVFAMAGASVIAWQVGGGAPSMPLLLLLASCLGFMIINWPRARVFMGDVGSGFLGLLFAALALAEELVPVWTWLILLGWFACDACLTILVRLVRGERIHEAHALHAYQHMNRALGTRVTLVIVMLVNIAWLMPLAALSAAAQESGLFLLTLAYIPMLVAQFLAGAGQLTPRLRLLDPDA